ncbi:hypothetical protein F9B85_03385 [Heliorestis acidaminivorans]|uniref:Uncharacterized protein n=1 Tax=Heliorestis acidaminivorans TaxID=553427 RepID=A0A6I0ESU5_9FIRM|nr:hypothetical protein [Heliorestis acidaminivorans]KAB2953675.1 hypothetical protein F9B85_03385 [Heliorestis acidaminivorans]
MSLVTLHKNISSESTSTTSTTSSASSNSYTTSATMHSSATSTDVGTNNSPSFSQVLNEKTIEQGKQGHMHQATAPADPWKRENWSADNAYRQSLLNPQLLPDTGHERYKLTAPSDKGSRSTDVHASEFKALSCGNIMRYDYGAGGELVWQTFIPNNEWQKTQNVNTDATIGTVYTRQDSAYGFTTRYDRTSQGNGSPENFQPEANRVALDKMMAQAQVYQDAFAKIRNYYASNLQQSLLKDLP